MKHDAQLVKRSRGPALDPLFDVRCGDCGVLDRDLDLLDAKRVKRRHAQDQVLGRLA